MAGVFAHFDHLGGLAAGGFATGDDPFSAATLAEALPSGARLVFSMGCHGGLNVSDNAGGCRRSGADVAQAVTSRGAVYLATTGYGYGDLVSVGLHERLMALFAGHLDGTATIGQAALLAKQEYFGSQGLYGAYDEKALSSTVLYGLPMWKIGPDRPVVTPPPGPTPQPVPGTDLQSVDFDLHPTFGPGAKTSPDAGSWFEVDHPLGGTYLPQSTPGRPVQPRLDIDVTAQNPDGSLLAGPRRADHDAERRPHARRRSTPRSPAPRSTRPRTSQRSWCPVSRSPAGWRRSPRARPSPVRSATRVSASANASSSSPASSWPTRSTTSAASAPRRCSGGSPVGSCTRRATTSTRRS